jgi:hypothetical protein
MFRKPNALAISTGLLLAAIWSFASSSAMAGRQVPDFYLDVTSGYARQGLNCDEAREVLQRKGFSILKTLRCGGNYHRFSARRAGYGYIIHVMTDKGQTMIDDRSR